MYCLLTRLSPEPPMQPWHGSSGSLPVRRTARSPATVKTRRCQVVLAFPAFKSGIEHRLGIDAAVFGKHLLFDIFISLSVAPCVVSASLGIVPRILNAVRPCTIPGRPSFCLPGGTRSPAIPGSRSHQLHETDTRSGPRLCPARAARGIQQSECARTATHIA